MTPSNAGEHRPLRPRPAHMGRAFAHAIDGFAYDRPGVPERFITEEGAAIWLCLFRDCEILSFLFGPNALLVRSVVAHHDRVDGQGEPIPDFHMERILEKARDFEIVERAAQRIAERLTGE